MRKLVTVVIHSYNRFDYLSNAINSGDDIGNIKV